MIKAPEARIFLAVQLGAVLVLALFVSDLLLNRHRDLEAGAGRIQRFNAMMAEHTARTFDAVDILLREMTSDLSSHRHDWPRWNIDEGWNYLAQRHSRALPQLRALYLYDQRGQQRHVSMAPPGPGGNVSQQPYFADLAGGKRVIHFGPYLEESSGYFTYALSHRIDDAQGNFAGFTFATLEPMYLQDFCWPNRLADDFETVLINASGHIIAACRPSGLGRQSALLGTLSEDSLFDGQLRGQLPASGTTVSGDFAIAVAPVPGFPELRMLTAAPVNSLLATWHSRLLEFGILATLVVVIILGGSLLMRRQWRKMRVMTSQLEASHAHLEKRVADATAQLAGQRDHAELANLAKSRFLAAASHDLRQPMHALSLFATDLQAQANSGTYRELPRLAEQIGTSTAILSELLDSLLDISRLDVAGIKPEIRAFPLQGIFDRLAASYRRAALDHKLFLRFRFTRLWLESDPALIERMIANLLSNAVRYTPRGGRILIAARQRGNTVRIEVRDSGMGIAPEHQAAVFAEFYQVGNTAREHHKGLGLGLSIVERLAQALKVDIRLHSALNRGTLFTLTVQGCAPQIPETAAARPELALATLYFIGDSPALNAARQLASGWGYSTAQQADTGGTLPKLPYNTIVLTEMDSAHAVRAIWPGDLTLIALAPPDTPAEAARELPEGSKLFRLPIRPAKLRALLGQLQNTSSKSIP